MSCNLATRERERNSACSNNFCSHCARLCVWNCTRSWRGELKIMPINYKLKKKEKMFRCLLCCRCESAPIHRRQDMSWGKLFWSQIVFSFLNWISPSNVFFNLRAPQLTTHMWCVCRTLICGHTEVEKKGIKIRFPSEKEITTEECSISLSIWTILNHHDGATFGEWHISWLDLRRTRTTPTDTDIRSVGESI